MNFKAMAEENESWIIEQRRYFHAHPEAFFCRKKHDTANREASGGNGTHPSLLSGL